MYRMQIHTSVFVSFTGRLFTFKANRVLLLLIVESLYFNLSPVVSNSTEMTLMYLLKLLRIVVCIKIES